MAFYCNGKKGICSECRGEGTVIYSRETYRDENSVIITGFEGICNTCHGTGLKPMTNADYFRAMSDEELADFIQHIRTNTLLGEALGVSATRDEDLEFLRKPAKDGVDE